jgi:predicted GNAT superfamily acetyltransferase
MALEDPAEVPARDAEARRRLDGAHRRGPRELVQEGHLAEDVARPEVAHLFIAAGVILDDLHFAGAHDEHADARVALTDDLLSGLPALLDGGVADLLERVVVKILEEPNAPEELDVRGGHVPRDGSGWHRRHTPSAGIRLPAVPPRIDVAHDIAACANTVPIQEEIWGGDVIVPPQLMLAAVHNGGFVALGYADGDERPAGFVFGFLGIHDHHFRHHSHMLAVRAPHRHTRLAVALKDAQREHCLDQGVDTIAWTMDPLEAKNARFNMAKLGAFARAYYRDFYGAMPDKLNEGLPSDRIYVEWRIATDHAARRLRGAQEIPALEDAEREGAPYLLRLSEGGRPQASRADAPRLLIEIPADVQSLKARDRALALAWRLAVREALEPAFATGYAAVELLRSADGARSAYLLVRTDLHP